MRALTNIYPVWLGLDLIWAVRLRSGDSGRAARGRRRWVAPTSTYGGRRRRLRRTSP